MTRNVALLVLDCARADIAAEELTRLREQADLVFDRCRAASPWSVPSHANLLTGELPHQHGVHAHNTDYGTLENTFLDELNHNSVGISANSYASSTFNFDSHFDTFHDVRPNRYFNDAIDLNECLSEQDTIFGILRNILSHDKPIKSALNAAYLGTKHVSQTAPMAGLMDEGTRRQIKQCLTIDKEPFFLFANFMEAHRPMYHHIGLDAKEVPYRWTSREVGKWDIIEAENPSEQFEAYLDRYRSLYRSSLRYMDRHLATLIEKIQTNTTRETTVIVTADHGENLCLEGDNGLIDHVGTLNDALLDVPLLVFNPPTAEEGARNNLISHLDIPRLVVEFACDECWFPDREVALAEVIGALGEPPVDPDYWDRAIRQCYHPNGSQTWDSLAEHLPEADTEYFDVGIRSYKKRVSGRTEDFDDATQRQLEDLGYL